MSSQRHVELRSVEKRFGLVEALIGVSLAITRGEIHAVVGENGAGKSTLGKLITGALRPDAGSLVVAGRAVSYRSPRQALKDGITLLAQERLLVQTRSVIENVFLGVEPGWRSIVGRRRLDARYAQLSERTGFDLPPRTAVGDLGAADQRKVEVLRALARSADLIVMDEPTAGLTRDEATKMLDIVRDLKTDGATVVLVSHALEDVVSVADTVSVLRDGRLVRTAPVAGESVGSLVTAMLGRPLDLSFPDKVFPADEAPVVLSVRGLAGAVLVHDVSLDLRAGEIVGLTGPLGSGRAEVARLLFGAERIDAGVLSLDGKPLSIRSPRRAIRHGIVFLPASREDEGLMMRRSVVENVALPHLTLLSRGGMVMRKDEGTRVGELIARLDVRTPAMTTRLAALSGGNQQKVLFAKWLFRPPRVLIANEPTRGVDVGAKRFLYELIHSSAAGGMSVVLVSDEMREVFGLAHRVLVMRGGRVVGEFDTRTASEEEVMHAALGADPVKERRAGA
jgi:ABC-type sugar transport system ATPase subunit